MWQELVNLVVVVCFCIMPPRSAHTWAESNHRVDQDDLQNDLGFVWHRDSCSIAPWSCVSQGSLQTFCPKLWAYATEWYLLPLQWSFRFLLGNLTWNKWTSLMSSSINDFSCVSLAEWDNVYSYFVWVSYTWWLWINWLTWALVAERVAF
jgi:hypothetical protein